MQVGDGYAAILIVTGYPAEVGAAWLDPLLAWPGRLDVVVYIDPLTPQAAAGRLCRQRARLESNRRADTEKGRLLDAAAEAAADAAAELADRIARGQSKLFRVGLYLCVHAPTLEELRESVAHVRAVAASVLLDVQPATWRQLQGWISTLPLATDSIGMRRVMDTEAIATMFPLASPDLPAPLPGDRLPRAGCCTASTWPLASVRQRWRMCPCRSACQIPNLSKTFTNAVPRCTLPNSGNSRARAVRVWAVLGWSADHRGAAAAVFRPASGRGH